MSSRAEQAWVSDLERRAAKLEHALRQIIEAWNGHRRDGDMQVAIAKAMVLLDQQSGDVE